MIFPCITYKLKEKVGGSLGAKGMLPPSQIIERGGGLPLPPFPSPMKH